MVLSFNQQNHLLAYYLVKYQKELHRALWIAKNYHFDFFYLFVSTFRYESRFDNTGLVKIGKLWRYMTTQMIGHTYLLFTSAYIYLSIPGLLYNLAQI